MLTCNVYFSSGSRIFEDCASAGPQEELARLFMMDKLTAMGLQHGSATSSLLGAAMFMDSKPKGKFDAQSGKWYRSAKILPEVVNEVGIKELMEAFNDPSIKFNSQSQTGAVFNMVPSDSGLRLSLMCIGDTHVNVDNQIQLALTKVSELLAEAREARSTHSQQNNFAESACDFAAKESYAGMTMFEKPAGWLQPEDVVAVHSEAGMTMFAPALDFGAQQPEHVTFDSACGMGLFSWKSFEGMDEVGISKALSEAGTTVGSQPSSLKRVVTLLATLLSC